MTPLEEVTEQIARLLADMHVEIPATDTHLVESGVIDSLLLVQLLTRIEDDLGVIVPIENLAPEHFRSLHSIATFVLANESIGRSAARG